MVVLSNPGLITLLLRVRVYWKQLLYSMKAPGKICVYSILPRFHLRDYTRYIDIVVVIEVVIGIFYPERQGKVGQLLCEGLGE